MRLAEILAVTGTPWDALKALRRRDQVAMAFGQRFAFNSQVCLPVDGVALLLADALTGPYSRDMAALLVRVHWPEWLRALALAEHDPSGLGVFCVADFTDGDGRKTHLPAAFNGAAMPDAVASAFAAAAKGAHVERFTSIVMNCFTAKMRENAEKIGLDLSRPFLPPLGDPALEKLLADYEEKKERAIAKAASERRKQDLARDAGVAARALAEQRWMDLAPAGNA